MNPEIKKKVNTIGKVGYILTIIGKVIVIAGIVCLSLVGVAGLVFPRDAVSISMTGNAEIHVSDKLFNGKLPVIGDLDNADLDFEINGQDYESATVERTDDGLIINAETGKIVLDNRMISKACLFALIYLTAMLVMLFFLGSLMKEFKRCDSPFAGSVIKKMTNFAWSLVPLALLSGFSGDINVGSITAFSMDMTYTLNLSMVLVILVLFALVQVFKYGAQLQMQADETL